MRHVGERTSRTTQCPHEEVGRKVVKSVNVEATRAGKEAYNSSPPTSLGRQGRKSINVEASRSDKIG